jgi:hypothetical protein
MSIEQRQESVGQVSATHGDALLCFHVDRIPDYCARSPAKLHRHDVSAIGLVSARRVVRALTVLRLQQENRLFAIGLIDLVFHKRSADKGKLFSQCFELGRWNFLGSGCLVARTAYLVGAYYPQCRQGQQEVCSKRMILFLLPDRLKAFLFKLAKKQISSAVRRHPKIGRTICGHKSMRHDDPFFVDFGFILHGYRQDSVEVITCSHAKRLSTYVKRLGGGGLQILEPRGDRRGTVARDISELEFF